MKEWIQGHPANIFGPYFIELSLNTIKDVY